MLYSRISKLVLVIFAVFCCYSLTAGAKAMYLQLPMVKNNSMSLNQALAKRRSVRTFSDKAISDEQMAQLLWAAQGVSDADARFRTAPSAGALYPLELYVVDKLGVWRYLAHSHELEKIQSGDVRMHLAKSALGQVPIAQAPVSIVITALHYKSTGKYGDRGRRYAYMEAGHAAQNLHLEAVALGLGSVPIGAFNDLAVQKLLRIAVDEEPLYIIPVGYGK